MYLPPVRVGVDTGGTFTDLVALAGDRVHTAKVRSTPSNPTNAVLQALAQVVGVHRGLVLTYSSTVATNALLERRGARVLLFTTAGFEDIIEIGRQCRPELYALEPERAEPLVSRRDRIGVPERMTAAGTPLLPLAPAALRRAVALARRRRPESIGVCFLHSYANPQHEAALAAALRQAGFRCCASHEFGRVHGEYERFNTAVVNAYVAPIMADHLGELCRALPHATLRVMQSNGGAICAATAAREAVRTILSGPAAGVMGAAAVAQRAGIRKLITLDMGGTSADVSLVDGTPAVRSEGTVGGLPVSLPMLDVHTIGAGGGSIAHRDPGGILKVGPQSAGADPGPACYGDGDLPTVTDANLLLGRLAAGLLGGEFSLQPGRARKAIAPLARALRLSVDEAAWGIVRVVNAAMERAIRAVSIERGYDPRSYTLVAFGGAAPLHACELAAGLGMQRVFIPRNPGVLSAWGAATAPLARDYRRTVRARQPALAELKKWTRELEHRARRELGDVSGVCGFWRSATKGKRTNSRYLLQRTMHAASTLRTRAVTGTPTRIAPSRSWKCACACCSPRHHFVCREPKRAANRRGLRAFFAEPRGTKARCSTGMRCHLEPLL